MRNRPSRADADVTSLYTRRTRFYVAYVQAFGHRQGVQAVLASSTALSPGQRILDAGCGTGLSILALLGALRQRDLGYQSIDAFDLTPAMLEQCRRTVDTHGAGRVELRQADVLGLDDQLPASWRDYNLIICASMLEHVPRSAFPAALAGLRGRLAPGGHLIMIITRRAFYPTRWAWHCEGYSRDEIAAACATAGLAPPTFRRYPWTSAWLNLGSHVIEATTDNS